MSVSVGFSSAVARLARAPHTEYNDVNSEIGDFLKNFFVFAFLYSVDVVKCFVEDLKTIQPKDERVQEFSRICLEHVRSKRFEFPSSYLVRILSDNNAYNKRL